jgi:hypothetical protein
MEGFGGGAGRQVSAFPLARTAQGKRELLGVRILPGAGGPRAEKTAAAEAPDRAELRPSRLKASGIPREVPAGTRRRFRRPPRSACGNERRRAPAGRRPAWNDPATFPEAQGCLARPLAKRGGKLPLAAGRTCGRARAGRQDTGGKARFSAGVFRKLRVYGLPGRGFLPAALSAASSPPGRPRFRRPGPSPASRGPLPILAAAGLAAGLPSLARFRRPLRLRLGPFRRRSRRQGSPRARPKRPAACPGPPAPLRRQPPSAAAEGAAVGRPLPLLRPSRSLPAFPCHLPGYEA